MWRYALVAAGAVALASTAVVTLYLSKPRTSAPKPAMATGQFFEGRISFLSSNTLKVGSKSVVLCGVVPATARDKMVTAAALGKFESAFVKCVSVGRGTPCDGKSVAKVGDMLVAQCKIDGEVDLATSLIEAGALCGTIPEYKGC